MFNENQGVNVGINGIDEEEKIDPLNGSIELNKRGAIPGLPQDNSNSSYQLHDVGPQDANQATIPEVIIPDEQ